MSQRITVEGTITPSTFLAAGDRRTVTRTAFVEKLITKGFIRVVDEPTTAAAETAPRVEEKPALSVPARNAKRDVWAAFLRELPIAFTNEDGRDELINLYEDSEHYVPGDRG